MNDKAIEEIYKYLEANNMAATAETLRGEISIMCEV